ncbi:uncharacterized protein G2W53_029479 [Senna tora]|uniref:Uncharacterized protein n=1 Tax=Senna tora TaxID=362788 RepID=A0A834W9P3_9FABA|nr:uncharacterized protein G2W53_029479 [Senna tora]
MGMGTRTRYMWGCGDGVRIYGGRLG